MSKDWKTDRTEVAIKEGTDKIMKAAQEKDKWESLENQNLDTPLTSWEEDLVEPKAFEICLGVGMNQFLPEYITINLGDNE
jgi:hypothetical protein